MSEVVVAASTRPESIATAAAPDHAAPLPAPEPLPPPPPAVAIARVSQPSLPGALVDPPAPQISPLAPLWLAGPLPVDSPRWPTVFDELILSVARRYYPLLDWRWLRALGIAESSLRENVTSSAGAQGLMQIMPGTWEELAAKLPISDPMDARDSVLAGVHYHRWQWDAWADIDDELQRMLFTMGSYHAGAGRIRRAWRDCGKCEQWDLAARYAPEATRVHVGRIRTLMGAW